MNIECPHCHRPNPVPPSAIGHYVKCANCGSKYWVYVPHSETTESESSLREPARPVDHGQVAIRQESLLATIHDDMVSLRRTITVATAVIVAACGALIVVHVMK